MKKMMAVFALLFVSAAVFLAAAFSANAAEEQLKDVGSNGLKISASAVEGEEDDYTYADGVLTIRSDKEVTISGGTDKDNPLYDEVIVVNSPSGANITLRKAYLQVRSGSNFAAFEINEDMSKPVKITLEDDNLLKSTTSGYAGLQKNGDSCKLIINGSGKLTAIGGTDGAAIGGAKGRNSGNIEISGSVVITAENDNGGGAGIGGGGGTSTDNGGNGSNITISENANVTATGYGGGAGIGGGAGSGKNGGDGIGIKITTNGKVTATGGRSGGAGIGGGGSGNGYGCKGGDGIGIKITDGEVKATGGGNSSNGGAGIGGGGNKGGNGGGEGDNEGITISGGTVIATGGNGGACIGGGYQKKGVNITIEGGTVEVAFQTSNNLGACIGGGYGGDAENIKITGGTVKAYNPASPAIGSGGGAGSVNGIYISGDADVIAAAGGGAGIGCGNNSSKSEAKNIEIFGSATVLACSTSHAGIGGSGSAKTVDTIKIYGDANVTAVSGNSGAGIGGSSSSDQEVKNISIYGNAKVTAIAGNYGAGIGGGAWNSNNAKTSGISISDNATVVATGNYGGAGIGSGQYDTATDITISGNATVIASSVYNEDLYDPSIFDTALEFTDPTTNNAITQFNRGNIGEWLENSFFPPYNNTFGVGIGSNKTDECVITIEGGTVTAYGNTKPGIGGDNAVVTIAGKNSKSCPIVCTNEIKSTTSPDNYPTEYWGIVFEDTDTNFDKGTVYGDDKAVDLSERPETYTLDNGKVLTVLDNVTFIPGNKFELDNSVLYLNKEATLKHWYEMKKVNGGEIQHEQSSPYKWYDVKDYSFVATDYTTLYKSGDKEGIVLCDICGKPESHIFEQEGGWKYNVDYHWHEGECDLRMDCSVNPQPIKECTYIKVFGGEFDKGEHRYDFSTPEKKDGKLHFYCIDCDYEVLMDIPVITLIKVDGATNNPLIGAEFGLYTNAACTGTPSATGTTATENGKAVVSFEAMPNMTYYIKETKAPDGYKLSDKIFKVTVNADGKVTYGDDGSETSPICENTVDANEPEEPGDNDSKPAPDDNNNSKPAPDDNNNSKPAPDDNNSKPAPDDNNSKPAPDNSGNPNTGIGIGIAGLALLGGSLFVTTVTKGTQRRKK